MYRSFLLASALAAASFANAQQYVHQVLVLNEGYFNFNTQMQEVPVTLGSYDPQAGTYTAVATIADARFGNHVGVDGDFVYVAADHRLLKYDANSFALLDEAEVVGIRRFAFWNDAIVITRGEVGGLSHYCEVRDKNTLDLVYIIGTADLPYSCEAVEVVGDKAYIAVNNGFEWGNAVGKLGVLDLSTQTWETSIDLGENGLNPENVMVVDGAVYTFNNKDFTGSSVSKFSIGGSGLDYTNDVALSSGCGSSAKTENRIYFMEYAQNLLNTFDLATATVADTLEGSPATYGLIDDPINGVMYGTTTDFFSSGELHVMDYTGAILSTVAVGVSPGKLALDVRNSTAINEASAGAMSIFPNPTEGAVTVRANALRAGEPITILDASGRCVLNARANVVGVAQLDVTGLANGIYTVRSASGITTRFTKR
ncbi:MAG: T9SS type A sorting domain-containing protein [Flavobacteriales bacterium]|nr:T9SS type A sorting domain-containing protein [Flavobacteriales bacterium]